MTIRNVPPNLESLSCRPLFCLHQTHINTDDPAHNLRLPRIRKSANLAFRKGGRDRRQIAAAQLAPAAKKFSAKLNKTKGLPVCSPEALAAFWCGLCLNYACFSEVRHFVLLPPLGW